MKKMESKKILIIDDDRALVKMMEYFLSQQGFEVTAAFDGEQGLAQLKAQCPHLVILDVHMPKMDGYNFILEAKKITDLKQLPVIVLTAKEGMDDLFLMEGAREYLVKPFQPEWLLEKIKKHL